jgi:hypothetical protein
LVELRLPRRAIIAAGVAAMAAFIAASAIASASASAETLPASDPSPRWVSCAQERGSCFFGTPSIKQVRYGDYDISGETWMLGHWTSRVADSSQIACSNAVFGDPFQNRAKHCEVDESPYEFCAMEGGICHVGAGSVVRYGAPSPRGWRAGVYKGYADYSLGYVPQDVGDHTNVPCTNTQFGTDPQPDVVKSCWIYAWWNQPA